MNTRPIITALALTALLSACEKEITVELPGMEPRIVVEGTIEPGQPPIVILTRTQGYFEALGPAALANMFVRNAVVTVDHGDGPIQLDQICTGSLTPEQQVLFSELTGMDPALLAAADICIYSSASPALFGEVGRTYDLRVEADGQVLTSTTTIPTPVALDSVWFKLALERPGDDTLGYAWARLTDPDTLGNCYRWMARRISRGPDGRAEDPPFISPLGNTFQDKYMNGLTVDMDFIRGRQFFNDQPEDSLSEAGFYKVGDTIAVKFVSIGFNEHEFYTSYDENVGSAGDLFSTPVNARTNIQGGLGIWAGWGVYADTIICQ